MSRITIVAFLLLGSLRECPAQFRRAIITVDGLTCSMCSYAVEQALRRRVFVEDVVFELNDVKAHVTFKENLPVDVELIIRSVTDAGFKVRDLSLEVVTPKSDAATSQYFRLCGSIFVPMGANAASDASEMTWQLIDRRFSDRTNYRKYQDQIEKAGGDRAASNVYYVVVL